MPFWFGSMGSHDDSSHQGSAKRDTNNGLAGLDVNGSLLIPGFNIFINRSGGNNITIRERATSELILQLSRVAANDYTMYCLESGVNQRIQTASMKNIASGIAGLDAQLMVDAGIYAPLNWLHFLNGNNCTDVVAGSTTLTRDLVAGTIELSVTNVASNISTRQTEMIAPSALARTMVFRISAISGMDANSLAFVGFFDASFVHTAGLTWDGTNWRTHTAGGTATVNNITAPAVGDVFVIYMNSTRVSFFKNGVHLFTHTTNLPTNAVGYGLRLNTPGLASPDIGLSMVAL